MVDWITYGGFVLVSLTALWCHWQMRHQPRDGSHLLPKVKRVRPCPPPPETIHSPGRGGKRGVMTVPVPKDDETINENMSLEDVCLTRRRELREIEVSLRDAMTHPFYHPGPKGPEEYPGQKDEMRAQTMLAIRAVEDARMRIGKVLQYMDDGVSILDK